VIGEVSMRSIRWSVPLAVVLLAAAFVTPAFANGTVAGTVLGPNGQPDPSIHIWIIPEGGGFYETGTDAQGKWSESVPAGVYYVQFDPYGTSASARGWWTNEGPTATRAQAQDVTVTEAATVTCNAQLPAGCTLAGTVSTDATSGTIPGVTVYADAHSDGVGGFEHTVGVVSDDGTFRLSNLMPGDVRLTLVPPIGTRFTTSYWPADANSVMVLGPGESMTDVEARVKLDVAVEEIAGKDRIATAIEVSKRRYPESSEASAIVIATAWNWPDALCGAPLAVAVNGPILLTNKAGMPPELLAEVQRLRSLGATRVYVLGSDDAVDFHVDDQLVPMFGEANIVRLAGVTRYGTSRAIGDEVFDRTGKRAAYIVTGSNYADALSAAPQAAQTGVPILFADIVRPGQPNQPIWPGFYDFLSQHIDKAFIVGDEDAVSEVVERDLKYICGAGNVRRYEGANRFETCLALIRDHYNLGRLFVTNGYNYPDALAGGVLAAANEERILLVNPKTPINGAVYSWLHSLGSSEVVEKLTFLGNDKAVQPPARAQVLDAVD
jgi:putative cell wall-binding protein